MLPPLAPMPPLCPNRHQSGGPERGTYVSVGEFLWYTIAIFLFVAYLMVLFYIFADLFRDHELMVWPRRSGSSP